MTQIDARTLVVDETPQLPMLPERPVPARTEDRKLTYGDLLKKMRWTDAQYETAQRFQFPIAGRRPVGPFELALIWNESVIDAWIVARRADTDTISALLARAK